MRFVNMNLQAKSIQLWLCNTQAKFLNNGLSRRHTFGSRRTNGHTNFNFIFFKRHNPL